MSSDERISSWREVYDADASHPSGPIRVSRDLLVGATGGADTAKLFTLGCCGGFTEITNCFETCSDTICSGCEECMTDPGHICEEPE